MSRAELDRFEFELMREKTAGPRALLAGVVFSFLTIATVVIVLALTGVIR